jgi:CubicO group peptidase (beta-lactamase class C family)
MITVDPEEAGLSAHRLQRLSAEMQRFIDHGQVAGLLYVLARRGQVAACGVHGCMDMASRRSMRLDAIFRIFSMTKPITSLAALMLYEEGALLLQQPVSQFIPAFDQLRVLVRQTPGGPELAALERPVTIHDLLTHTSGLGYGFDDSTPVNALCRQANLLNPNERMADKIERLVQIPLHHQPGKGHTYSLSTDVLGLLVELIAGMPLDVFFQERIFGPLGMVDTGFYVPKEKLERLARLYTPDEVGCLLDVAAVPGDPNCFPFGPWTDKSHLPAFLSGGAGLVSTASDYLRFGNLLRGQGTLDGTRLVSQKTIRLLTAPHLPPELCPMPGVNYGLGLTVLTDPAQAQMPGSPGAYDAGGAAHTSFWYDLHEDLMGLLMAQYIYPTPLPLGMDFKVLAAQAVMD